MHIDSLLARVAENADKQVLLGAGIDWTYAQLQQSIEQWDAQLDAQAIAAGNLVAIRSDFRGAAIACLLALFKRRAVAVMLSPTDPSALEKAVTIGVDLCVEVDGNEQSNQIVLSPSSALSADAPHPLIAQLLECQHPGFVVFSSGSSGSPKAVLHDADGFCTHLVEVRKAKSTVAFLALDHIAGIDTLLYTLLSLIHI